MADRSMRSMSFRKVSMLAPSRTRACELVHAIVTKAASNSGTSAAASFVHAFIHWPSPLESGPGGGTGFGMPPGERSFCFGS